MARIARPYADPYFAGVALGLVLLTAYALVGRGLGASGAFASAAASMVESASPAAAHENFWFAQHLDAGALWRDWLIIELVGVMVGAWISARLAGRIARKVERGSNVNVGNRLVAACAGGALMGVGAVLARGCTSGQALTGGALLSVGSWVFIASTFATGYVIAYMRRGAWS